MILCASILRLMRLQRAKAERKWGNKMSNDNAKPKLDVTKVFGPLEDIIKTLPNSEMSKLKNSLHFVQVFAQWGTRLPVDDDFYDVLQLGKANPEDGLSLKTFPFTVPFSQGNKKIISACEDFLNFTLGDIIAVIGNTRRYAKTASSDKTGFPKILSLLDQVEPNKATALTFLNQLIQSAQKNSERAQKVATQINAFRTEIRGGEQKIDDARSKIEADVKTRSERLRELRSGDKKNPEAIAHFLDQIEIDQAAYDENTKIASTSLAYAWVAPPIPIGLIPALVIATVYGDRARCWLTKREEAIKELEQHQAEALRIASIHAALECATQAVEKVDSYARLALDHASVLANGWSELRSGLQDIADDLESTTVSSGTTQQVLSFELVEAYLSEAASRYEELVPYLDALTTSPYIEIVGIDGFLIDLQQQTDPVGGTDK